MGEDRGLVDPAGSRRRYDLVRVPPSEDLAAHVTQLWRVSWDLPEPYEAVALPFPALNLTVETVRGVVLTGVTAGRYSYPLEGSGRVLGCRFRAGGAAPLLGRPAASLRGQEIPAVQVVGTDAARTLLRLLELPDDEAFAGLEAVLRRWLPVDDPSARLAARLVEDVATRPDVVRVEQLAAHAHLSVRAVQRLFDQHVGVGPKWVLMRERLHDAVEALAAEEDLDVAALAARLGYADQAHLTRDVRAVVGLPPAEYARRARAEG